MFNNNSDKSLLEGCLVELATFRDSRGALSFVQKSDYDFSRAFWIYDVPEDAERGGHAHRTCEELLLAVHGSFDVELYDGENKQTYHLDAPNKALVIKPMVWCRLFNFSNGFVGLCLASQEYQPEGYINTIEDFDNAVSC